MGVEYNHLGHIRFDIQQFATPVQIIIASWRKCLIRGGFHPVGRKNCLDDPKLSALFARALLWTTYAPHADCSL